MFSNNCLSELKVLGLLLKGGKTKEISNELGVAQQTVTTFKTRIFKKLGTENILQIQKMAELHNINFS